MWAEALGWEGLVVFEELKKEERGRSVEGDEGGDRAAEAILVDYREDCEVFLRCNRESLKHLTWYCLCFTKITLQWGDWLGGPDNRGSLGAITRIQAGSAVAVERQKEMDLINTWVSYRR